VTEAKEEFIKMKSSVIADVLIFSSWIQNRISAVKVAQKAGAELIPKRM
jgi:hypothetical protein